MDDPEIRTLGACPVCGHPVTGLRDGGLWHGLEEVETERGERDLVPTGGPLYVATCAGCKSNLTAYGSDDAPEAALEWWYDP